MCRPCLLLISFVVAFGAIVRFLVAASDPLWIDELHTAWCTNERIQDVSSRAAVGNQQPLYYWIVCLVRYCASAIGQFDSPTTLRLASLIAGTLLMVAVAYLIWNWTRSKFATFCGCWMTALETQFIFYSTEARPYALIQLVAVIQVILFWRWLERFCIDGQSGSTPRVWQRADWGLVISTSLLMYLHLTGAWLPLAELLFFAFVVTQPVERLRKPFCRYKKVVWQSALLIAAICGMLLIPMIPHAFALVSRRTNWEAVSSIVELFSQLQDQIRWGVVVPLLGLFAWVVFNGFLNLRLTSEFATPLNLKQKAWFAFTWLAVPIAGAALLDFFGIAPMAIARYTLVGTPAFPVFAAICLALVPFQWQRIGLGVFLIFGSCLVNPWQTELLRNRTIPQLRFEDWTSPILEINHAIDRREFPIFLFANLIEDRDALNNTDRRFQEYLAFPLFTLPKIDQSHRTIISYPTLDRHPFQQEHLEQMVEAKGTWLVIRGTDELVLEIVSDLQTAFQNHHPQQNLKTSVATFEQSPRNDVKLIQIEADP